MCSLALLLCGLLLCGSHVHVAYVGLGKLADALPVSYALCIDQEGVTAEVFFAALLVDETSWMTCSSSWACLVPFVAMPGLCGFLTLPCNMYALMYDMHV